MQRVTRSPAYLKLVLVAAQGGALFLPEVVGLDDAGRVDLGGEVLLQHLEDGLDGRPGRSPHVQHGREATLPRLIAGKTTTTTTT